MPATALPDPRPRDIACLLAQDHSRRPSLLAGTLAMHLLGLALPLLSLQTYDRILRHPESDTLPILVTGVVIAIVVEAVIRWLRQSVIHAQEAEFGESAHALCLSHLLHLQSPVAAQLSVSEAVQQLEAIERMKLRYGGEAYLAWIEAAFLFLYIGALAWLAGWLALVPITILSVFTMRAWQIGETLHKNLHALERQDDTRYRLLTEILEALHSVKAAGRELAMFRRCEAVQKDSTELAYRSADSAMQRAALGQLTGQVMLLSMMTVGAWMAVRGHLTTGILVACVLLAGRLMQPVQRILGAWTRAQEEGIARQRLVALSELPLHPIFPAQAKEDGGDQGKLEVRRLSFGYEEHNPILRDLSLTLAPGESLAIEAVPGSGTSTLLRLLAGQLSPRIGEVRLDGVRLSTLPDAELARHVAYLPSTSLILRGSVMDNLTAFQPELRSEALWIAEQLGMLPAITRLPAGWETLLEGSEADSIPPGLKQRITIARALLHRPKLILFDQADRALDTESYNAVFRLFGQLRGQASIVLVSEDANLLRLSDRRVRLFEGQLVPAEIAPYRPRAHLPMLTLTTPEAVSA